MAATKQADSLSASLDRIEAMLAEIRDDLVRFEELAKRVAKLEKAAKGGAS